MGVSMKIMPDLDARLPFILRSIFTLGFDISNLVFFLQSLVLKLDDMINF